jgi:hypothetical protein
MILSKSERLALIYQRLTEAPGVRSSAEALALIQRVFAEVEDAHSGLPIAPEHLDRMYPPIAEMEEDMPGMPLVKRYRHKRHCTLIAANGVFEMRRFLYSTVNGLKRRSEEQVDFAKACADGRGLLG